MAPHPTCVVFAAALALATAGTAAEPARVFGTNPRTDQRLSEAATLEKAERWAEAVDFYVRIADESGDDLVPASAANTHLVPARTLVQQRIGARPEMIRHYRARFEPRAQQVLAAAHPLDPKPLTQVVTSSLCTRAAETALHRLGDLACEAGDFAAARRWWSMLLPPERPGQFVHPDPAGDVALVRAKLILARLLAGETAEARADMQEFRRDHAASTGHLAGCRGNLLATLERLNGDLMTPVAVARPGPAEPTTFGLDPSRNAVVKGRLPAYAPEARYPPIVLPEAASRLDDRLTQQMLVKPAALAFHPLVVNRRVYVADAAGITGFDLDAGARISRLTLDRASHRLPLLDTKLPSATEVRFTLTTLGDRLFARLGQPRVRCDRADADSYLVCARIGAQGQLKLAWSLPALKPHDAVVAVWEGTPLVRDGRLYAAVTRLDGNRAVTVVSCFDPSEPQPTLIWQQDVIEAAAETADRTQHLLLTAAGPLIVCGPHAGAVVALDAATGRRAWAARYEAADPKADPADAPFRELGPCVAAGATLYAAPADAERVFAYDGATGSLAWQSDPLPLCHLLGVVRGTVVGQRAGPLAGLAALDAATGRQRPGWGYAVFGADAVAPFGRGLLAGDRVYWPTRSAGVRELHLDGTVEYPPTSFQGLPGGNLAYGDGGLIVATEDRLHVLLPPRVDGGPPAVDRGHAEGKAALRSVPVNGPPGDAEPLPAVVALGAGHPRAGGDDRVITFDPGRERAVFAAGFERSVFIVSRGRLERRDWPNDHPVWTRLLDFAPEYTDSDAGVVIVAGATEIAGIDAADGRVAWHKRVSASETRSGDGWRDRFSSADTQPALNRVSATGGEVRLRLGLRTLDPFDARTGDQIDRRTHDSDVSSTATGGGLAFTAGERRLVATDSSTGRTAWERAYVGGPSLTGELPRLRLVGGDLLLGLPRNDGYEIERLDPKSGKPRPGMPFVRPGRAFDLSAAAVVDGTLVVAAGGKLMAWEGSRKVWQWPLPVAGPWRLEPAGKGLVAAWPVPTPASPPLKRWPVLVVAAADGRVAARWEFSRPGANGAVQVAGGTLTVSTESEVRRVNLPGRRDDP